MNKWKNPISYFHIHEYLVFESSWSQQWIWSSPFNNILFTETIITFNEYTPTVINNHFRKQINQKFTHQKHLIRRETNGKKLRSTFPQWSFRYEPRQEESTSLRSSEKSLGTKILEMIPRSNHLRMVHSSRIAELMSA